MIHAPGYCPFYSTDPNFYIRYYRSSTASLTARDADEGSPFLDRMPMVMGAIE